MLYYLLIFKLALPLLQTGNLKRFVWRLAALWAILFIYEFLLIFNLRLPAVRHGLTVTDFILWHVFIDVVMLSISFGIALLIEWNSKSKRQQILEKQKSEAELAAIKYQINPHFLFNSLSFIYSKTVPLNDEVAQAVLLLSDIMRYALSGGEDQSGKVNLNREITHLKNVIQMNQLRYNHGLHISYHETVEDSSIWIPPLVLITLVENAFKHGDISDSHNPLEIQITASQQKLNFYISNKKKKGPKEISTGIGLSNVHQRLELPYGPRHSFRVKEDDQFYTAELIITF